MNKIQRMMVAGFLFHGSRVLLVCKLKPSWQHGLWNGVGGKSEKDEAPIAAMMREFLEETGVQTLSGDWTHFATEMGRDYVVHFYKAKLERINIPPAVVSVNDAGEPLAWMNADDAAANLPVIGNLHWLVPLARDWRVLRNPVLFHTDDDIREKASW